MGDIRCEEVRRDDFPVGLLTKPPGEGNCTRSLRRIGVQAGWRIVGPPHLLDRRHRVLLISNKAAHRRPAHSRPCPRPPRDPAERAPAGPFGPFVDRVYPRGFAGLFEGPTPRPILLPPVDTLTRRRPIQWSHRRIRWFRRSIPGGRSWCRSTPGSLSAPFICPKGSLASSRPR